MIDSRSSTKDIAAHVRQELKKEFPDCSFSVTSKYFSGGSEINVYLMTARFPVFLDEFEYRDQSRFSGGACAYEVVGHHHNHVQVNHYCMKDKFLPSYAPSGLFGGVRLTDRAQKVLIAANDIANKFNWDKSDIQSDYFNVNYYFSLAIGKWDRPFTQV